MNGRHRKPTGETEERLLRARYSRTILQVLIRTAGQPDITTQLAIGEACTAHTASERAIWLECVRLCEAEKAAIERGLNGPLGEALDKFMAEEEAGE